MPVLKWKQFVGQDRIKEVLGTAFERGTLGHAYLFCGDQGTGKFIGAIELAMALLCNNEHNRPCYECEQCRKVLHYSHPDLHVIMPVALQKEHRASDGKLNDEGWKFVAECVSKRISKPYYPQDHSSIPSIPVDWVRELNHAIIRGSLEGGRNVAILDGIDTMSKEAANAMLKTLEEPPAGTIMLLLTEKIHSVLPTIVSRCQILRFPYLSPDVIRSEIVSRCKIDRQDHRLDDVIYTGSLGRSIFQFENPREEILNDAAELWNLCAARNWDGIIAKIDALSETDDYSTFEKFFERMVHLVRNAFFAKTTGTENYIMGQRTHIIDLKGISRPEQIEKIADTCRDSMGWIQARAQVPLVLVQFVFSIMEIIDGKE